MQPSLQPDQEVLIKRLKNPSPRNVKPGAIVYLQHPLSRDIQMIKRCSHWEGTKLWVLGDNPKESTDSRQFGAVATHFILGTVVCTFP